MSSYLVTIQIQTVIKPLPPKTKLKQWAIKTLECCIPLTGITHEFTSTKTLAHAFAENDTLKSTSTKIPALAKNGSSQCEEAGKKIAELTIRLVDLEEGTKLNEHYRHKKGPTNVLSFSYEQFPSILGDIIICVPVVLQEAKEQTKTPEMHFAHLVVHGVLHVLGYDHQTDLEAQRMQMLENTVLTQLGFVPPYLNHASGESLVYD